LSRVHPSLVGGPALVHVDAYRLGSPEEVDALDLEASLADSVTVVEWGEGLVEHLVDTWLAVTIERSGDPDDETRVVSIEEMAHGESSPTEDETRVVPIEEATRGESTPPVVLDHDGTRVGPVEEATRG
jgi:tRNA threonylcarbamoyladenosine biosynthesis protein TsaE